MACANSDIVGQTSTGENATIQSPVCVDSPAQLFGTVISLLLIASAVITFLMLILGGIQYITSAGDPEKAARAKGRLTFAIIGLTISFLALVIFKIISNIVGISILF